MALGSTELLSDLWVIDMDIDFYTEIKSALCGQGRFLGDTTPERADWSGPSVVAMLYDVTSNDTRGQFVSAMKRIIDDREENNRVITDAVRVATALNLTDLDSSIRKLAGVSIDKYVTRATQTYIGYRDMAIRDSKGQFPRAISL